LVVSSIGGETIPGIRRVSGLSESGQRPGRLLRGRVAAETLAPGLELDRHRTRRLSTARFSD
jgi:hypothetical protein